MVSWHGGILVVEYEYSETLHDRILECSVTISTQHRIQSGPIHIITALVRTTFHHPKNDTTNDMHYGTTSATHSHTHTGDRAMHQPPTHPSIPAAPSWTTDFLSIRDPRRSFVYVVCSSILYSLSYSSRRKFHSNTLSDRKAQHSAAR